MATYGNVQYDHSAGFRVTASEPKPGSKMCETDQPRDTLQLFFRNPFACDQYEAAQKTSKTCLLYSKANCLIKTILLNPVQV